MGHSSPSPDAPHPAHRRYPREVLARIGGSASPRLELRLADPAGDPRLLASVAAPADTVDVEIAGDEIHLVAGTLAEPRRFAVTSDGALAPIASP
jgi:hypothetical protein